MKFNFEKLVVWQKSLNQSHEIHLLTKEFPKEEMYNMTQQIKRAADSVVLNIAEGSTGQSKKEFTRFLNYSIRSCIEVVSCLFICKKRELISNNEFTKHYAEQTELFKMLTRLKSSIKSS